MSTPNKPVRLSADEFLKKIEEASSYAIVMNVLYEEMELGIRGEDGQLQGYLGPDPETADPDELIEFLERLLVIVGQDADIPEDE